MRKRIFFDLITDIKKPANLWKFFIFSLFVHCLVVYGFVNLPFSGEPTARAIHLKKGGDNTASPAKRAKTCLGT